MKRHRMRVLAVLGAAGLALAAGGGVSAQEVKTLKAYVMSMPSLPTQEAAKLYEQKAGVKIEFVAGPPGAWMSKVKEGDGDLVLMGSEYGMDDLQRDGLILPETRASLGNRVAAILVPKGNPKRISSIRDLAAPGMRIMIMPAGGQVGLWEDVAAKAGLATEIRRNIVERAVSGIKSVELWKDGAGTKYDAWLTWASFQAVLPERTEIVELPRDLQVMRSVAIAATKAGKKREEAGKFIAYLTGPEGRAIHEKHHFEFR